jgi:hypothetical protein
MLGQFVIFAGTAMLPKRAPRDGSPSTARGPRQVAKRST